MGQLGMGAMLHLLGGGSEKSSSEYEGAVVKSACMVKGAANGWHGRETDRLRVEFEDGRAIDIWDDGQSCCESRWITTDDDPSTLVGGKLVHIAAKDGPEERDGEWGDVTETCFVEVQTDKGFITLTTHNSHNGYYGGFGLTITEVSACPPPSPAPAPLSRREGRNE